MTVFLTPVRKCKVLASSCDYVISRSLYWQKSDLLIVGSASFNFW
jgi:hypothetical protein